MFNDKSILVTGATGSFGQMFVKTITERFNPRRVIVYSRDEWKQSEMQKDKAFTQGQVRFFLGDVRDKDRLCLAMRGVDFVIHAAALKQVPAAEYNPFEAIKTNVLGTQNLIDACLKENVETVVGIGTDKAVSPLNTYGATKLLMEKLLTTAQNYLDIDRALQ